MSDIPNGGCQTSLRVPRKLYDKLSEAAARNDRSLGAEMRSRLTASFATDPKVKAAIDLLTEEGLL